MSYGNMSTPPAQPIWDRLPLNKEKTKQDPSETNDTILARVPVEGGFITFVPANYQPKAGEYRFTSSLALYSNDDASLPMLASTITTKTEAPVNPAKNQAKASNIPAVATAAETPTPAPTPTKSTSSSSGWDVDTATSVG